MQDNIISISFYGTWCCENEFDFSNSKIEVNYQILLMFILIKKNPDLLIIYVYKYVSSSA